MLVPLSYDGILLSDSKDHPWLIYLLFHPRSIYNFFVSLISQFARAMESTAAPIEVCSPWGVRPLRYAPLEVCASLGIRPLKFAPLEVCGPWGMSPLDGPRNEIHRFYITDLKYVTNLHRDIPRHMMADVKFLLHWLSASPLKSFRKKKLLWRKYMWVICTIKLYY